MAAKKKRYEVVRSGPVGGHAPGEEFSADPDNDQVKAWLAGGAIAPAKKNDKDADKR